MADITPFFYGTVPFFSSRSVVIRMRYGHLTMGSRGDMTKLHYFIIFIVIGASL
jgi:hypothetical protein